MTALESLAYLSRQDPTPEYFVRFHQEVNAETNERGAAVLLAANTELCLRFAIKRHLVTVEDAERLLFRSNGPLRGFEAKTRIGLAMGLYGTETANNLNYIRVIRNAFAHAVIPIGFETAEVVAVVRLMTMPDILPPRAIDPASLKPRGILPEFPTTRQRYQKICEAVSHNLFVLNRERMPLP